MSNKRKSVIKNDLKGEAKTFIIIVIVVLVIIVLLYFLTSYLSKNGNFGGEYVTTPTPEAVMTYEDATVGTSLNRVEDEYYVVFEDFGDENKSFISSLIANYTNSEKHLPIYKVDMTLDVNKKFKSDVSNKNASSVNELKIKTPTLLLIKDKKIEKYIEGSSNIKSELKVD